MKQILKRNFVMFQCFFQLLGKSSPFLGWPGDRVFFSLKFFQGRNKGGFFVWSWGSCFGSFRACGGAVGWKGYASCWKASKKRRQTWQNKCAGIGWDGNSLKPKVYSFQTCLFEIGNLILIVWRFALWWAYVTDGWFKHQADLLHPIPMFGRVG